MEISVYHLLILYYTNVPVFSLWYSVRNKIWVQVGTQRDCSGTGDTYSIDIDIHGNIAIANFMRIKEVFCFTAQVNFLFPGISGCYMRVLILIFPFVLYHLAELERKQNKWNMKFQLMENES